MSIRTEKVSEEIKHRISEVLSKDLAELNLGLVTVTKVTISNDLKNAKIYLSFLGNKDSANVCIDKINFRKKLIRMHLASRVHLKSVPELAFYYDDTMEYANKIDQLIQEIHKNDK
ncbi:MAG: 30S ribosome-binding factor RbfA [Ignavibacteria bacterium]